MKKLLLKFITNIKTFGQQLYITVQMYGGNGLSNHAAACAYGFLLSMAPMLLLLVLLIFYIWTPSPDAIFSMINTIPFLDSIFDEEWLYADLFFLSSPGIPGIISVLSIFWAGRILALSMQRGLGIVFQSEKKRNTVKNTLITLGIEISVIIFALVVIISSRTAMYFYSLLDSLPRGSVIRFVTTQFGSQVSSVTLLGFGSFLIYLYVPVQSPRKLSAFKGALFCSITYFCLIMIMRTIMNSARYNFLYGTFGNLIIILVNVYFFFMLFFLGAQLTFVTDSFDALLFSVFRNARLKEHKKNKPARIFGKYHPSVLLSNFFNPSKCRLKKYLRCYKKNEVIFFHGDASDNIYYLLDGEVEVWVLSAHGSESFAGTLKPDSLFGEMGYLLSEERAATIKARTDVSVLALPPLLFNAILLYDNSFDRTLIEHMARRLKDANKMIPDGNP